MDSNNKKQWPVKLLAILIILIAFIALFGITLARYVMEKSEQGVVASDDFYFYSDLLKDASEKAEYYIDPAKNTFQIKLMNYADALRITQKNINFTVSVENGSAEPASGTFNGSNKTESFVTITPVDNAEDIKVTVTSTAPYEKTISAVFHRIPGNQYKVEDAPGNRAAVLTMTCIDDPKSISITLPAGVIPDEADGRVAKGDGDNTYQFQSPGHGIFSLVLLKSNTSVNLSENGVFADSINLTKNNPVNE